MTALYALCSYIEGKTGQYLEVREHQLRVQLGPTSMQTIRQFGCAVSPDPEVFEAISYAIMSLGTVTEQFVRIYE